MDKEWIELKEWVDELFKDTYIYAGRIYDSNTMKPSAKFNKEGDIL